jgi:hypothetical protein
VVAIRAFRVGIRGLFLAVLVLSLLLPTVVAVAPARAAAEAFSESFRGTTLGVGTDWIASKGSSSKDACLTGLAEGSSIGLAGGTSLVGCPGAGAGVAIDPTSGTGALRLTDSDNNQASVVLYQRKQSIADGLDITFGFAMHSGQAGSGATGADGLSFFIKNGDAGADTAGAFGGALGYALSADNNTILINGVPGALLGVGFDFYGNFSNLYSNQFKISAACGADEFNPGIASLVQDRVAIRGPDTSPGRDGTCGYEYLGRSTAAVDFGRDIAGNGTRPPASNRVDAARRARVIIDKPGSGARVKVFVWPVGTTQPSTPSLDLPQPEALRDPNLTTFKFGFGASTGGATNVHEIWDLQIVLADPVVQAAKAAAAAAPSGPSLACTPDPVAPGAEVTCTVTSGPPGGDILWRAAIGERVVGSLGVTMDDDGVGSFSFRAPSDAAGAGIGVELVDWGVETSVAVSGGPVPTRVDAGAGGLRADALVLLLAGFVALIGIGARRQVRQR